MGFIRLFLAISVVMGHTGGTIFGFHGIYPFPAVNAFFIISGFYMTLVLNEKYDPTHNSLFFVNRIIRLFPTYFIGLALALIVSVLLPAANTWQKPNDAFSWIYVLSMNLFIFGQDLVYVFCIPDGERCVDPWASLDPPAWSIAVELMFYAIAPFLLRSINKTAAFAAAGIAYLFVLTVWDADILQFWKSSVLPNATIATLRYYFFPSSIMFFGLGSLSYHIHKLARRGDLKRAFGYSFIFLVLALMRPEAYLTWKRTLLFALLLPIIFELTKKSTIDRLVGEFSYPVYILHFPILAVLYQSWITDTPWFTVTAVLTTLGAAAIVFLMVERPIDAYRAKLSKAALRRAVGVNCTMPSP